VLERGGEKRGDGYEEGQRSAEATNKSCRTIPRGTSRLSISPSDGHSIAIGQVGLYCSLSTLVTRRRSPFKLAIVAFFLIADANKSINAASSNCPSRNELLFGHSGALQCATGLGAHPLCSPHTTRRRTNNEQLTVLLTYCFTDIYVSRRRSARRAPHWVAHLWLWPITPLTAQMVNRVQYVCHPYHVVHLHNRSIPCSGRPMSTQTSRRQFTRVTD
jgi:hypothetical protein